MFAQQRPESGLLEMLIRGESRSDVARVHDHNGDAVGKTPLFVRTLRVEVEGRFEKAIGERDDLHIRVRPEGRQQLDGGMTILQLRKSITDFQKYRTGCDQADPLASNSSANARAS